jgi:hypothetical protein
MANKLTNITAINDGCGANTCTGTNLDDFDITPKVLTVQNVSVKQTQCWAEFKSEVIRESYNAGINMPDLNGTQLAQIIGKRTQQGIQHDTIRNMWAGDLALVGAVANCSYASMGDGLWKLLSVGNAIGGATQLREFAATGTAAANLIAVGATIAPADAELLLRSVFDGAPSELQQTPAREKKMFVTPNIYNAYYGALTSVAVAGAVDAGHSEAQSGANYPSLRFRGVEIVPMYEWDTALSTLAAGNLPLFTAAGAVIQATQGCIYAAKSNLFIGTDVSAPENNFKMFFDEVAEDMKIRAYFTMGFQYGWNSLVNGGMLV